jgi:hypothetical protein
MGWFGLAQGTPDILGIIGSRDGLLIIVKIFLKMIIPEKLTKMGA